MSQITLNSSDRNWLAGIENSRVLQRRRWFLCFSSKPAAVESSVLSLSEIHRANAGITERQPNTPDLTGRAEEWGPLVRQPAPDARLARTLNHAAQELWDACTYTDSGQMWEEARAIASRILASCPGE